MAYILLVRLQTIWLELEFGVGMQLGRETHCLLVPSPHPGIRTGIGLRSRLDKAPDPSIHRAWEGDGRKVGGPDFLGTTKGTWREGGRGERGSQDKWTETFLMITCCLPTWYGLWRRKCNGPQLMKIMQLLDRTASQ